ncbi:MAG: hypothetical protein II055_02445, partial [Prevotella sp.]|nr:hypothetical protein [Prevotella sp.]
MVVYSHIDLQTMRPHRKTPKIANVFSQMGIVEELGSGMRVIFTKASKTSGPTIPPKKTSCSTRMSIKKTSKVT